MNTQLKLHSLLAVATLLATLFHPQSTCRAQGTAFTYQGLLKAASGPANGSYDLTFTLYNTNATGAPVSGTVTNTATAVSDGLFIVTLDFGGAPYADGAPLWLQIGARTNGAATFSALTPRQALLPTPYAIYAESANATNLVGTVQAANLSGVALLNGGNTFSGNQTLNNGNVGIGTASPATQLANTANNIYGSDGYGFSTTSLGWVSSGFGYAAGFYNPSILSGGDGVTIGIAGIGTGNRILDLWSGVSSNTVMMVNGNGRVGIGTAAPSATLEVNGNAQIDGTLTATSFAGNGRGLTSLPANAALLNATNNFTAGQNTFTGYVGIGLSVPPGAPLDIFGTMRVANSAGQFSYVGFPAGSAQTAILGQFLTSDTNYPELRFSRLMGGNLMDIGQDGNGNFGVFGNTVERMTVQAGGNVGIGTNKPSAPLEVNGNAQIDGTLTATSFAGNGSGLTSLPANAALLNASQTFTGQNSFSGNVGIGTASPATQLANTANNIYGSDGYGFSTTSLGWVSSGFGYAAGFYNPSILSGGDGVTIGIAGIGTGNRILDLWSGVSSNTVMMVNGNGRVGIGTAAPSATLEVNGNAQIDGTLTATSFAGNGSGLTSLPNGLGGSGNTASGPNSLVAGGGGNQVDAASSYSTIGAGNANTIANTVYATIGGGNQNTINNTGGFGTIGGGNGNFIANTLDGTIAGGYHNVITNGATFAAVGGGNGNAVGGGLDSVIGGGFQNYVNASFATVPGGANNSATANYSLAAGDQAQAVNAGAFVWADAQGGNFYSTNNNSFNVRAQGGARFVTTGAGLSVDGPVTATSISGSGSGLTSLPANAALLNASQTFTGQNSFSGSLGIGTSTPATQLANTANNIYGSDGFGLSSQALGWYSTVGGYAAGFYNSENFSSGDGVVVSIVNSSARVLDLLSGGRSVMAVNGNGNVGIGTNTPSATLEVNGNARIDGTLTATGFAGNGSGLTNVALLNQQNTFAAQQTIKTGPGTYGLVVTDNTNRIGYYIAQGQCSFGTITPHALGFFVNNGSDSMDLNTNGFLGIGTAAPGAPLDVEVNTSVNHGNWAYFNLSGANNNGGAGYEGSPNLAIYTPSGIGAAAFYAFSDARIKNIVGQSDCAMDLKTLLGLKVTDYTYIDTVVKGDRAQKKLIAQQVEQVYPQAVSQSTDVVPDIFKKATVKDGWVQLTTSLKVGDRVKLIGEKELGIYPVLEVRNGGFRTEFKPATEQVFVYGREVSDFRRVDYEAISMLNVSATQELARKVDAQQAELKKLEAKLGQQLAEKETLLQHLAVLEARDQAREDRLARLESTLEKSSVQASYAALNR